MAERANHSKEWGAKPQAWKGGWAAEANAEKAPAVLSKYKE